MLEAPRIPRRAPGDRFCCRQTAELRTVSTTGNVQACFAEGHDSGWHLVNAQLAEVLSGFRTLPQGTLDPLVSLVDESQQNVLAVDNDSGGNHNARLRFVIPSAGNYVIRFNANQLKPLCKDLGFDRVSSTRYLMKYGHPPGRLWRQLDKSPLFDVSRFLFRLLGVVIFGRWGNKLAFVAERT